MSITHRAAPQVELCSSAGRPFHRSVDAMTGLGDRPLMDLMQLAHCVPSMMSTTSAGVGVTAAPVKGLTLTSRLSSRRTLV